MRVAGEFLTVHWTKIIRDEVKLRVTPAGAREQRRKRRTPVERGKSYLIDITKRLCLRLPANPT